MRIHRLRRLYRVLFLTCATGGVCAWLWAATGTVAPDGDSTTGNWSSTPLFSKVNEDINSPDGVTISSPNNPSTPTNQIFFDITCPADVGTITEAQLRIRARKSASGGREISFTSQWTAAGAGQVTSNASNISETMTTYNGSNITGLSVTKAQCNESQLRVSPSTSGGGAGRTLVVDTLNLDIAYDAGGARRRVVIAALNSRH